jgi:hypothetical protein
VYQPLVFPLDVGFHSRSTLGDVRAAVDAELRRCRGMSGGPAVPSSADFDIFLYYGDANSAAAAVQAAVTADSVRSGAGGGRGGVGVGGAGAEPRAPWTSVVLHILSQTAKVGIFGSGDALVGNHRTFVQLGIGDQVCVSVCVRACVSWRSTRALMAGTESVDYTAAVVVSCEASHLHWNARQEHHLCLALNR